MGAAFEGWSDYREFRGGEENARQTKVTGDEVTAGVALARPRATDRTHRCRAHFARYAVLDVPVVSSITPGPRR